jgi:hypothetical protein
MLILLFHNKRQVYALHKIGAYKVELLCKPITIK